jgi:hypothetical protein
MKDIHYYPEFRGLNNLIFKEKNMKTFDNPTNEEKEMIRYWIDKYENSNHSSVKGFYDEHLATKPNIEVGKWYKNKFNSALCYCINKELNGYGFSAYNDWVNDCIWLKSQPELNWIEATEQEATERLIEEANRRGYVLGNHKCLRHSFLTYIEGFDTHFFFRQKDNTLWIEKRGNRANCVFENGKWADIIDEKAEVKETIARLESELETLKKQVK